MDFNATFIVTIISFLAFMCIMNKIFYAPLKLIGEKRNKIVTKNNDEADEADIEAQALSDETDKKYSRAIIKANKNMSVKINETNFNSQKKVNEAKDKSFRRIIEIKNELKKEEENAFTELNSRVDSFAELLTDKILKGGDIE